MTTLISGNETRTILLGNRVQRSTGTLTNATIPIFTVAGGLVMLTSLVGRVTVALTVANTYGLQHNPTLGTTVALGTAADLGTTDTAAGEILVPVLGAALAVGSKSQPARIILDSGQIESISSGTDGAILWALTYVPIDDGASVVAA